MEENRTELEPEVMQPAAGGMHPTCSGNTTYRCNHSKTDGVTYLGEEKIENHRIMRKYRCKTCWCKVWVDCGSKGGASGSW